MLWILGIILGIVFILFAGAILSINVKNEKKPIEPPVQPEELMDVPLPEEPEKKPTKDENWEQRRLEAYRYLQMVGKEHQLNERELDVKHSEQEVEIRELKSNLVDIGLDQKEKSIEQKIKSTLR